ncbi:hypothetical protein C3747_60g96 [Trypanosoma cruzi]|uniref:Uncharacterized protein n=2 Tax=Trypanosoma cruzi TaxID=5693 RepID=Q4DBG6_TRYCC|nr:hypothetical protein, conserved [Trypanosoma cruzi]EAN89867.1 hypothetical protein, conserved [Trypanosoma cruzi]PWV11404.1 hypothetical protein C3747_60g96 [Trypanosoma cruzi]RNC44650.1 hypothetical protein TcCL_NonESM05593 [Trypanosoma cruzi]|eukprot:XP_811718.1 hypothetical protein [Trypanosoma cruzi strain CL Brener]
MASVNQSIESNTSSLQRSGLSMSVGDTKSIVLALQALQDKIRRLEQDRNHHQDQYERALQAHEAYKQDMEHQLERERTHHRQREKDLQEMVQRATTEKTKLQNTLEESRKDLGTFRTELEEMLIKECDAAQKRENALASEVDKLRQELEEQQKRYRALLSSIEELRAEKEAALDTNHHLEQAIQELMRIQSGRGVNRTLLRSGDTSRLTAEGGKRRSRRGRTHSSAAVNLANRTGYSRRISEPHQMDSRPTSIVRSSSARHTYRDPTYSSIQRDVRKENGTQVVDNSFAGEVARPVSYATESAARTQPSVPLGGRQNGAMAEVCQELESELKSLHQQYKETVERAAAEEISAEVVAAALNRLAKLMDRKKEQIQLIKEAQRDMAAAGTVVDVPTSRPTGASKRRPPPVGSDKVTQRSLIVNELRSLLSPQHS